MTLLFLQQDSEGLGWVDSASRVKDFYFSQMSAALSPESLRKWQVQLSFLSGHTCTHSLFTART